MRCAGLLFLFSLPLAGADDRNFAGSWTLDAARSEIRSLPYAPAPSLRIEQDAAKLQLIAGNTQQIYLLTGETSKQTFGATGLSTQTKWEGAALVLNSLSTTGRQFSLNERWRLGRDGNTLIIRKVYHAGVGESESTLVYQREGAVKSTVVAPAAAPAAVAVVTAPRTAPESLTIPSGTRVLLRVNQLISTKIVKAGDRLYLETAVPVTAEQRVVIPRGSQVTALVKQANRGGRGGTSGELVLEFTSIILANGTQRDIQSHLSSADGRPFDRGQGGMRGQRSKVEDAGTIGNTASAGASLGSLGGHMGTGAAAGAAAGLAGIFAKRGPDVEIAAGSMLEMSLDRDLQYNVRELP
ncbi:MAG: hypothetical protein JNK87_26905 [Bryobacterales bacterium]|nr:hypothetical protein [Bryobacterales bacterium]